MEEKKTIPLLGPYNHVSMALRELCEVMDHTQSMYHHLFVQTLHIKKAMRTAMSQLQQPDETET